MTDPLSNREDNRAKIVAVAARLLREHGSAGVTTRGVAEGADVQPPTIYRLFGDKDGLLEAVADHVMASHVAKKAAVVESADFGGVDPLLDLRAGWDSQIQFGLENPDLFGLMTDPARVPRSGAVQAGMRVLEARVHRIAEIGRLRVSERRAVDLIHAAGTGVVQTLLGTPHEQRDLGLSDTMYDAILGRILSGSTLVGDDNTTSVTVAFRAVAPGLAILSESERGLMMEWLDRAIHAL